MNGTQRSELSRGTQLSRPDSKDSRRGYLTDRSRANTAPSADRGGGLGFND
jgi:hypothetical protein